MQRSTPYAELATMNLQPDRRPAARSPQPSIANRRTAFTLIELLVVIAVISILAALIIPITGALKKKRIVFKARGELAQVESAIQTYKTKLGYYPPDDSSAGALGVVWPFYEVTNQLYYELLGTSLNANGVFQTLDGSATISPASATAVFGTAGFMNCTKGTGGDYAASGAAFLKGLKAGQFLQTTSAGGVQFNVLGTTLDGPFVYHGPNGATINPWRYNASNPTNNPGAFDLWVDVYVGNETNRVCNWSSIPLKVY